MLCQQLGEQAIRIAQRCENALEIRPEFDGRDAVGGRQAVPFKAFDSQEPAPAPHQRGESLVCDSLQEGPHAGARGVVLPQRPPEPEQQLLFNVLTVG